MRLKWKALKVAAVIALLVAGLAGGGLAGTVSADRGGKGSHTVSHKAPNSGTSGQPFILVFD